MAFASWAASLEVVRGATASPLWRVAHDTSRTVAVRRMSSGQAQNVHVRVGPVSEITERLALSVLY